MSVLLVATGGTIASRPTDEGVRVVLSATEVLARCAAATGADVSDVEAIEVAHGPSWSFDPDEPIDIARHALGGAASHDGVVVTHGTDTLEETLFLTWLLSNDGVDRGSIVFTGAMRHADHPESDGPRNLADSLDVARYRTATASGPVLCMSGGVHHARWVTKTDSSALDSFKSVDGSGNTSPPVVPADLAVETAISQVQSHTDADETEIIGLLDRGARGLIVEGTGAGNVHRALVPGIERAIGDGIPVVITTRCWTGSVAPDYGGVGGGRWLADRGAIPGGDLPSH
ncbi:MAG: asparaginase, partial [Acidimicrobiales bacterium]